MTDISNTKYVTINKDGVFVAEQPVTTYHGEKIYFINGIKANFAEIQSQNPKIQELHIGAFETKGELAEQGTPSGVFGRNAWARVKLFDGRLGPWVFTGWYGSASNCASYCVSGSGYVVRYNPIICPALLDFAEKDSINTENKQKEQYKTVSVFKTGIFRVTIEKIKQR